MTLVIVAVLALIVAGVGTVAAAQGGSERTVYSGCLNENSGVLTRVAIGEEPAKPCEGSSIQISWDDAGTAFEGRIVALEQRVDELEEPLGTLDLSVDCGEGETVGEALNDAQGHLGPVNIVISGVCEENVFIDRDDVNLFGQQRSDGIRAATAGAAVAVGDAQRVRFFNMTISGGDAGISGAPGASFLADGVTVKDASVWGVLTSTGGSAELRNCLVETTNGAGIATDGGTVFIQDCTASENFDGMRASGGGTIRGFGVDVTANSRLGAVAQHGGVVELNDSAITDNGSSGVLALWNATVWVRGGVIANNAGSGASAGIHSMVTVDDGARVVGNASHGIDASQASTIAIAQTEITANGADGIVLFDQSAGVDSGGGAGGNVIADNGGLGINCAGPPGFPEVQNGFDLPSITFGGNSAGDTNCP